ncbi:hypothetical protein [Anaerorhabdus sp.]
MIELTKVGENMQLISFLINVALVVFILSMAIAFVFLIRRNTKNKKIVECVEAFDNEDVFFNKIDNYIELEKDNEFKMKGKILKLWGCVKYDHKDSIEPLLNEIDCTPLFEKKGKYNKTKASLNEDSFYYLCLACCNTLYGRKDHDLLMKFKEKLDDLDQSINRLLVYQLSMNGFKLYQGEEDLGEEFFSNTLQGDTGDLHYAKQLIGIYKDICAAYLTKIYFIQNRSEDYEAIKEDMQRFYRSGLGKRYLTELEIPQEWVVEPTEPEESSEEIE